MDRLIEIKDDLFDISARLKSIDENYKIYFNGETRRYELHNCATNPTFQAIFPHTVLDKRALDFALNSAVKNKQRILDEIDGHNAKLEKLRQDAIMEKALNQLRL